MFKTFFRKIYQSYFIDLVEEQLNKLLTHVYRVIDDSKKDMEKEIISLTLEQMRLKEHIHNMSKESTEGKKRKSRTQPTKENI